MAWRSASRARRWPASCSSATNAGGTLTMVDLATMQTVNVATGGTRGDFLHVSPDGRLYITQSNEVDVLSPVLPPHVIAATPVAGRNAGAGGQLGDA